MGRWESSEDEEEEEEEDEDEEEGEARSRYSDGRSSPGSCEVKSLLWF